MIDNSEKSKSSLGPRPWDKVYLKKYYLKDFSRTRKEIEALSGGLIFSEINKPRAY